MIVLQIRQFPLQLVPFTSSHMSRKLPPRLLRILLMLGADLFLAPVLPLATLNTEPYCSLQAPGFLWPCLRPPETSLFQPQGAYEGHSDLLQALMLFDWLRHEHPPSLQPSPDRAGAPEPACPRLQFCQPCW
ncbi:hypothetical protein KC356_g169 [Hortaea werneckii]|nr:hypothetical protein KC356_g169 [Hortaea werneckii]